MMEGLRRALEKFFGRPSTPWQALRQTGALPAARTGGSRTGVPSATTSIPKAPRPLKPAPAIGRAEWVSLVQVLFSGRARAGIRVKGSLCLAGLRLRSIPGDFTVKGSLDLRQCQRLSHIGDGLRVHEDLTIGGKAGKNVSEPLRALTSAGTKSFALSRDGQVPLRSLPERLRVGGNLSLAGCNLLEKLPTDFSVGGSLHLRGCHSLRELPDGLAVHGDLRLIGARNLHRLPEKLAVHGNLHIAGAPIESLPQNLTILGSLTLEHCHRLTRLPPGLQIPGDLKIIGCPIDELPKSLGVGGGLRLCRLPRLREIPEGLPAISGSLICLNCPTLERIGPGLQVGVNVILRGCAKLKELPEQWHIPGRLCLQKCSSLAQLPSGLAVGTGLPATRRLVVLDLRGCTVLSALPQDLKIRGNIELSGSGVRTMSDGLARHCRLLWRGVLIEPEVLIPEILDAGRILNEPNVEVRRIMIERFGLQKLLADAGADLVDEDTDAGGPRRLLRFSVGWGHKDLLYLHCHCPSSCREYLLRVPPTMSKCHAAAAWLAGFDNPDNYKPVKET